MRKILISLALITGLLFGSDAMAQTFVRLQPAQTHDTLSSNGDSFTFSSITMGGFGSMKVQTLDSYSGTWTVYCSLDGSTYDSTHPLKMMLANNSSTVVTSVTDTVGIWDVLNASGCRAVKVIATAGFAASDTTIWVTATQSGGGNGGSGGGGGGGTFDGVLLDAPGGDALTDTTNNALQIVIVGDSATDINNSAASLLSIDTNIETIKNSLVPVATHDQVALTTGDQMIGFASAATPTAVSGDGDAARLWVDLVGRIHTANEKAEDAAHTSSDLGVMALCVRESTATDLSAGNTNGDYEPCTVDASTRLWTHEANSDASLTSLQLIDNLVTDPCAGTAKTYVPFSISTATTTQLIAASASNSNYICSINIVAAGADNVALVEDDTSACASPTAGMAGGTQASTGWNFAANGGLVAGNGRGTVFKTAATNRYTCLITSAGVQLSGTISYVQAP